MDLHFDSGNIPLEGNNIPPVPGDNSAKEKKKRSGALYAASLWRSPTAHADPHNRHSSGYANTGTNISYEGATAPGSGGCVGTGYASGKDALDEKLRNESDYAHMRTKSKKTEEDESKKDDDYTPNNDV
ncbi:hypothetical protein [Taibaiella soli]|uniref:Uncharacterized protein n=1 Tax=Taibaiella soli TaxID=1649169 RepID=A0A2W2BDR2_9BACT|nr:hypothetical protein [Taibaiella soli]PZF74399.1 hypothetical protein DN068_02125 [Taibaiella soli]